MCKYIHHEYFKHQKKKLKCASCGRKFTSKSELATAISFLFSAIFVSIFIVCKLERIKVAKKNIGC
ncbi:hypothetical protein DERF_001788 [Dermatophagoides farinae]|uniref:C2H2-type domain-containing protein n=1 Tax=Dermatophagoides farinae TaxID=6954 RepID=A0A922IA61_DERFA|nr:hypothetical protein DERF_001788 [Dermatophagoides farinae]